MYFGGHKIRANGTTFLRLPAVNPDRPDVIGELTSIITVCIGGSLQSYVTLQHWTIEAHPHFTEGLPRVYRADSYSCLAIDKLIDRVEQSVPLRPRLTLS